MGIQRFIWSGILLVFIFFFVVVIFTMITYYVTIKVYDENPECYHEDTIYDDMLDNIDDFAFEEPKRGKSVFFHATTCKTGFARLNARNYIPKYLPPRQACAIESAALANPNWDVFVLFPSRSGFTKQTDDRPDIIRALEKYPNIQLRNVDLWTYAQSTFIEDWIKQKIVTRSKYLNSYTAAFLRYLSLYKYGGTYLDLDVIVMKNLSDLRPNYAGAESSSFVAAGVLNFDAAGQGHEFAKMCLKEFRYSVDHNYWSNNGSGVITRVLHRICNTTYPPLMTLSRCSDFGVFPIESFYAVPSEDWYDFFDERVVNKTMVRLRNSIVAHVWKKHSANERVRVGSNVAYGQLAAKYCPLVYSSCGDYF